MANIDPITCCFLPGHSGDLSVGNSLEIEESIKYTMHTKDFRGFVVALVRRQSLLANIDHITWCFLPGHSGDLSVGNSLEIEESIKYTKDF